MSHILKKSLLLSALSLISTQAYAAGTTAQTVIGVPMVIGFEVSSTTQTDLNTTQNITVAQKIDLTISEVNSPKTVAPDSALPLTEFTIQNTGNFIQAYTFATTVDNSAGILDGSPTFSVYHDVNEDGCGTGPGTGSNSADDVDATGTYIDIDPAVDDTKQLCVYSSTDVAAAATTGQQATITLRATTNNAGTTTATVNQSGVNFNSAVSHVLFSDSSGPHASDNALDGTHSASAVLTVGAASLSVSQEISVVYDNVVGTCASDATPALPNTNKAIPGACVNFKYTLTNGSGSAEATNINWLITLPIELSYVSQGTASAANAAACDDTGNFDVTDIGNRNITCHITSLNATETAVIEIRAIIQ